MPHDSANRFLVGRPGGRHSMLTPALLVEVDLLDANIARMQSLCDRAGVRLRPHGKAHKSSEIARKQIDAGAAGLCVATLGEAEVFAAAGIENLLLTSTFAGEAACERAVAISAMSAGFTCVFDNAETARQAAAFARARESRLRVLIDLDMGRHRAGVARPADAVALGRALLREEALSLVGLQAYSGHLSHCRSFAERSAGARAAGQRVSAVLAALAEGLSWAPAIVTGGSTGGFNLESALGIYTELQAGSYIFMDTEYEAVDPDGESGLWHFQPSLLLSTSVTSANHPGQVTVDCGEKRIASKYGVPPRIVRGALPGAVFRATSDEHGVVDVRDGEAPAIGSIIEMVVPHCDPTVNLYNHMHVVRGDTVDAIWPIDARGA